MEKYEEILTEFVSRLSQKTMAEQDVESAEAREMADKLAELEQRVHDAPLDAETKILLDRYISARNALAGLREEYLYAQGAKDCVRFLRELGVLK